MLADFDDLDELGGVGVEVNHVASFLGGLRAGVHGDADIGLRQRRSVIRAVARHGHKLAFGLFALNERHLVFRLGFSEEVVQAGLFGDGSGRQRVVAGDHHSANPHRTELVESLLHPALHNVF